MISVCIATYNGEKYIRQQIESILEQFTKEDEIIISDDGSTDNTLNIINSFNDSRIKVYKHSSNKEILKTSFGNYAIVAKNFENALQYAKGEYIFMSDQDDLWDKNRVNNCIKELEKNVLVMVNYKIVNAEGTVVSDKAYKFTPIFNSILLNIIRSRFMCCCLAFNKSILQYALPFPDNVKSCEQWLGNIAVKYGRIKFLKYTYHLYRRHGENVSETSEKSRNNLYKKILFRYILLKQLLNRFKQIKKR